MSWLNKKLLTKAVFWTNFIAAGAIIVSVIAIQISCNQTDLIKEQTIHLKIQDEKINDLNYTNKAMQFRPDIEVVGIPHLDSLRQIVTSSYLDTTHSSDIPNSISGYSILDYHIVLHNKGSADANLIVYITTDTTIIKDYLRNQFMDDVITFKKGKNVVAGENLVLQLSANDTLAPIPIRMIIPSLAQDTLALHFLMIYSGENGILYDTYYKAMYRYLKKYMVGDFRGLKLPWVIDYKETAPLGIIKFVKDNKSESHFFQEEFTHKFWEYYNLIAPK